MAWKGNLCMQDVESRQVATAAKSDPACRSPGLAATNEEAGHEPRAQQPPPSPEESVLERERDFFRLIFQLTD